MAQDASWNTSAALDPAAGRRLAAELFNHVWTLLETAERTPLEDAEMIHAAHASRYLWGQVGTAENVARGEWQVSRVYSVLGRGNAALFHARLCLATCAASGIADFDLAYAHEALARAELVLGNLDAAAAELDAAEAAGQDIAEDDDRQQFTDDLAELVAVLRGGPAS